MGERDAAATGLVALVVDDEAPARAELAYLLGEDPRIAEVHLAESGTDALRALESQRVDVIFCDVSMPGLDGIELARVIARFAERPSVVFVTAYDEHAVDAFALEAADYVMKPVRTERITEAVRRVASARRSYARSPEASEGRSAEPEDESLPVELGGVTRFVQRSEIRWIQAQGDYARLHTAGGSHLVRIPLATLEQRWEDVGFVRIHRSTLVAMSHVEEVRVDHGRYSVVVAGTVLPVSRRHTPQLRARLTGAGTRRS